MRQVADEGKRGSLIRSRYSTERQSLTEWGVACRITPTLAYGECWERDMTTKSRAVGQWRAMISRLTHHAVRRHEASNARGSVLVWLHKNLISRLVFSYANALSPAFHAFFGFTRYKKWASAKRAPHSGRIWKSSLRVCLYECMGLRSFVGRGDMRVLHVEGCTNNQTHHI